MIHSKVPIIYNVDPHELVREFHIKYAMPVGDFPQMLTEAREALRMDLIEEELEELQEALANDDIIEAIDALGDMVYVIYGMAIEMGVNLAPVLEEIQRSNMSKLDENGKPIYRSDGKVLKGPYFSQPNIADAIGL